MPTMKLTRRNIASIEASDKPVVYYDEGLSGFGLKVQPSGARSWIIEYRPGAGGRGVAKKRMVIGKGDDLLSPEEARDLAKTTLARVRTGSDPAAARAVERNSLTVAALAGKWLSGHVETKRKPSTAAYYRQVIETHVVPHLGAKRSTVVTRSDVAAMHAAVGKSKDGIGGRYVANRAVAVLSAIYGWADGVGLVPEGMNPTRKLERFAERSRERYLSTDELARLGSVLRQAETTGIEWAMPIDKPASKHRPKEPMTTLPQHVTAAVRLLLFTGARLREILHLEWGDVDLERGLLLLPDSKTGKKTVVLGAPALAILKDLPRIGRYVIAGETAGEKDEKPRSDLKRPWTLLQRAAQLEGVRLHDLRHTFASIGAGRGLGLPIVGSLLGHADVKTTGRYAHVDATPARAAANAIAAQLKAAMEGDGHG